jgi:hypothetical protein
MAWRASPEVLLTARCVTLGESGGQRGDANQRYDCQFAHGRRSDFDVITRRVLRRSNIHHGLTL